MSRVTALVGPVGLVARTLARHWTRQPVRLLAAIAGSLGGVVICTAVFTIALPVLRLSAAPPLEGLRSDVIAVAADAPRGMSSDIVSGIAELEGVEQISRLLQTSTTVAASGEDFVPAMVLGIDPALTAVLDDERRVEAERVPALQADEVLLVEEWARRNDVAVGDAITINTPSGAVTRRVAALVETALSNGGAVVVAPDVVVAQDFGFQDRSSILLVRTSESLETMRDRLGPIVDGSATVGTPSSVYSSYMGVYLTPLTLVSLFAVTALLTGLVVIYLTWQMALTEVRNMLATMRLTGASRSALVLGPGVVMMPLAILAGIVGAGLGVVVGDRLSDYRRLITNFTGQAFSAESAVVPSVILGVFASVAMFVVAWLSAARTLRSVAPIEAIRSQSVHSEPASSTANTMLGLGVAALAAAVTIVLVVSGTPVLVALIPMLLGLVILCAFLPPLVGRLITRCGKGPRALMVGRQLSAEWRRNAVLATTFAVALTTSMTLAGVSTSIRGGIETSNERWSQGDLYLQAAPLGENLSGETLPAGFRNQVASIPGVESTMTFSYSNATIDGRRILVSAIDGDIDELTDVLVVDAAPSAVAPDGTVLTALTRSTIIVSANYSRTHGVGVGDRVSIPTSGGHCSCQVVAVIDDSTSDGGAIQVSQELFEEVVGPGVFYVGATLADGANAIDVRSQLENLVATDYPRGQVLSQDEYRDGISGVLTRMMTSFTTFAWVMFLIATLIGAASLTATIVDRRRALAVASLAGGSSKVLSSLLTIEAMTIVAMGWLIAVPASFVAVPSLIAGQSLMSGLLPTAGLQPQMTFLSLPIGLVAVFVAVATARRSSSRQTLAESVASV